MPLNPDGFGQELIKKPSLDLHAVAERDMRALHREMGREGDEIEEEEEGCMSVYVQRGERVRW